MEFETINVASDDGIVTLTLNRPESFNAMTPKMGREVAAATREIAADPQARVLVIAGAGMAFCSGGDLGMLARSAGIDCGPDAEQSMAEAPQRILPRIPVDPGLRAANDRSYPWRCYRCRVVPRARL